MAIPIPPTYIDAVKPSGTQDGVNLVFSLPSAPDPPETLAFYLNGVLQTLNQDYVLNLNVITLNYYAPLSKDYLIAYYRTPGTTPTGGQFPVMSAIEVPGGGDPDGSKKNFTLINIPNPLSSIILTLDGILQSRPDDFVILGNSVNFVVAPQVGTLLLAEYRYYVTIDSGPGPGPDPDPDPVIDLGRKYSILKNSLVPYIRNYLNDLSMAMWSDGQLNEYINQAEIDITQRLSIYWARFPISLVAGIGLYNMPVNLKGITRMTHRGTPVEMITQTQTVNLSSSYRTTISKPMYAYLQFEGYYTLRLFPEPSEDLPILSNSVDIYTDKNIQSEFQISAYFFSTESNPYSVLPDYISRRSIRYFVMWKAFSVEGDGQDIQVSDYYRQKYESQVDKDSVFIGKIFGAKERQYQPQFLNLQRKVAKPVLPPNFGETIPLK